MPELIRIIFDCWDVDRAIYEDPKTYDAPERCHDANEALISYLEDHHISYYLQWMERSELIEKEQEFAISGIREYGG